MPTARKTNTASRRRPLPSRQATTRRRVKGWTDAAAAKQRRTYRSTASAKPQRVARRRRPTGSRLNLRLPHLSLWRLAGLALAALLVAGLAVFFASDQFYVNAAEINGITYSPRDEVYQRAGVHDYSVFWIEEQAVAQRLQTMPFVKSARVSAVLPNKVRIDIVEREPAAIWRANGRDLWVDSEGITLPVASQLSALPILVDTDGSSVTDEDRGRVDPRIIAGVIDLNRQLPNIGRFAYDGARGLHFNLPNGTVVVLGENEWLAERVQQLIGLQSALAAQGRTASEIDLSHDDGYYMKLAP